ncbi:DUF2339 domain-containing protein [Shewanella sp. JNE10-2]|uniref:DUF2339 domain-containing protein n=1 Tax=unclassified Shewanella TaxID=196818 RepID=UPI0020067B88|nr:MULTISPECIES: DUF2339 domain-containing protein [unclassified Shewanella]MCK7629957.1 DUF2339 domain-containing protein [Shewanella sp. JNE9-1]MCK7645127.1 DUF2339 domain-containing protein [Shewanella sp. JNE3-1]MCK7653260.1 DUF2339 domain-containing protein [Shewanella sp. JNE4-1]UPO28969.1 DUF2339 domain-containing protein [Shewanella sp. JNE10-2]UPO36179.1 DUF2339 domain-containing protein [Shewanella sp. JNE7]
MPLKDDVAQLKAELAQLQSLHLSQQSSLGRQLAEFSTKLETLSQQIATEDATETTLNMAASASSIASVLAADNAPTLTYAAQTPTLEPASVAPAPAEPNPWQQNALQGDPWQRKTKNTPAEQTAKTEHQAQDQQLSDEVKLQASVQAASQFDELLSQGLAAVMAPFAAVNEQVKSFYHHYQAKGLGPVFLMTVAGIITLTLGFGYLLQYSINHWFSELGKALLGFASANAIIVGGIFIRQKRAGMADFGSGIVGLGLILNYLCAYFIGPYFELIPNSASFILLLLITLAGYGLSMRLDAKVIAVIALVGGSTAPMMLLSQSYAPLLYLPYLLLIGAGALAQSRKLKWPLLLEITALLHIGCIEAFSYFIELPLSDFGGVSLLALISINATFYLYGITSLLFTKPFTHHNEKHNTLSHRILALPIALLAFVLLELTQFTEFAGEIFAINALICAALYWKLTWKRTGNLEKARSGLLLVFAGSFAGFAALYLLSHDFLGLVLLLEALLLLWIGTKEELISVRAEAYVLLLMGLGLNASSVLTGISLLESSFIDGAPISPLSAFGFPLLALALSCAALVFVIRLLTLHHALLSPLESQLNRVLKELLSGFYVATIILAAYLLSSDYYLAILPLVSLLLLYLSAKDRLVISEFAAWFLLLPLLFKVVEGITLTGSFSFSAQPLMAKLARIELFTALLLAHYWYRRHYKDALFAKAAYTMQIFCYLLLPLILLPKIIRNHWEYTAITLWLSTFMSIGLAYFVKHKSLNIEARILTWLAVLMTASLCLIHAWQGLAALAVGALFMGFTLLRYRQLPEHWRPLLQLQWQLSPYYFALVLAVIVYGFNHSEPVGIAMTALALSGYFALLIQRGVSQRSVGQALHSMKLTLVAEIQAAIKESYHLAYGLTLGLALLPIMLHFELTLGLNRDNASFVLIEFLSLALLARLILQHGAAIRLHRRILPLQGLKWSWHLLLALSYFMWSYSFDNIIAAPLSAILLVIHGSVLMFISLKPQNADMIRLAAGLFTLSTLKVLLLDMASFELVQKVIAFMLIGVILLTVSYFYQKARNRLQQD